MHRRHCLAGGLATAVLLVLLSAASPCLAAAEDYELTRADVAWFVACGLAGGDVNVPTGPAQPSFTDVLGDHWAYPYVEYCAGLGVVSGYPGGDFHPAEAVNRGQMAVYVARAVATPVGDAGVPDLPAGTAPTFPDVTAENDWAWAYKYVEYLVALGMDVSWPDDPSLFHPERPITAYAAASWLDQGLGIYIDPATIPHPFQADFSAGPAAGPVPLIVQFTDGSTGHPSAWAWELGDGTTSTEQDPSHTYAAAGLYTVSLTASNPVATDTETKPDYINAYRPPPIADFSAAPTSGATPLVVQFTDQSYQGDPDSWAWDFGDGGASGDQNPAHIYTTPGRYTVRLVAADGGGESTRTQADLILATFPDVPLDHWALDSILACVEAGIVQGYPGGNYGPGDTVTRGQMAVYVARALAGGDALVPTGPEVPHFNDVGTDNWTYDYVEYARFWGIVQGYFGGGYHPDEVVNRGQMAVYIARSIVSPPGDVSVPDPIGPLVFPDVTADNDWAWCYKHVQYIATQSVVSGYWDGAYHPERDVTRDQMAVYVARAFQLPM